MSATLNLCAGGPLMIAVLKELIGDERYFGIDSELERIMGTRGYVGRL